MAKSSRIMRRLGRYCSPRMKIRCVIVEDQTMFLHMLHNMLQDMLCVQVVATARTEAAGLAACERHRPDLLVLDLALPDGNGIAIARRLMKLNQAAKTIILSGEASTFVCPDDLRGGVHAILDKTQAFDRLARKVRALVPPDQGSSIVEKLSAREYEVFRMIGRGLLTKEIADVLGISTNTVQTHRKSIAQKLGTQGSELLHAAIALRRPSFSSPKGK